MTDLPAPATEALDGVLEELVDRMAHQIRNPLQAVVVNLEVLRLRGPRADAGTWEGEMSPFVEAIEGSVGHLERRLGLLVAVARAGDEDPEAIPLADRIRDLVGALGLEPAPAVRFEGPAGEAAVSARPGHLVALLHLLLEAVRTRGPSDRGGSLHLREEEGRVILEARLPEPPPSSPEARERMATLAAAAGGTLEVDAERGTRVRLAFPRP